MTMTKLEEILAYKQVELEARIRERPLTTVVQEMGLALPPLELLAALCQRGAWPALIAECKRASPSRGVLAAQLNPPEMARVYAENGAAAVSVLTDERFFQGSLEDLRGVAKARVGVPLLRKDFIFDLYQVYEARAAGADAVLLIVAALDRKRLRSLHDLAHQLGMGVLVEVHDRDEVETALTCEPRFIGINNRNLHDFSVRLETSLDLRQAIPAEICVVAESGIRTAEDVCRLAEVGVNAVLVGEGLVTAEDIPAKVRSLAWTG